MAVLKRRERLVYFRISEDEFHQFVRVCEQEGARSLSDLARSAVQRLIVDGNEHPEDRDLTSKVQILERLIAEMTAQLQFVATLLKNRDCVVAPRAGSGNGNAHYSTENGVEHSRGKEE